MSTTISSNNRIAQFDLRELDDHRQWSGDTEIISAVLDILSRSGSITLPGGEDPVPVDPTTPLHNTIAAALSLGMNISDDAEELVALSHRTSAGDPSSERVVLSIEEFLATQSGVSVGTAEARDSESGDSMIIAETGADTLHASEVSYAGQAESAQKFTLISAAVPPAVPPAGPHSGAEAYTTVSAPVSPAEFTTVSAPVPASPMAHVADLGDADPFNVLTDALGDTDSPLFSEMVRRMGLTPRK